jgi:hypothetical protein
MADFQFRGPIGNRNWHLEMERMITPLTPTLSPGGPEGAREKSLIAALIHSTTFCHSLPMKPLALGSLLLLTACYAGAAPVYLENQFDLPKGFRIYRAAGNDLAGGSYDIAFDGKGRLLVGDGKTIRRLADQDNDGVYDSFESIAEGLGGRGPQGLIVRGDRLYAVGGDGLQLFEGYNSGGRLTHRGRLGAPFNTGGDHGAHTILPGHDGYLYFVSGDGGGVGGRKHITEETSPALTERAASVFRISPDGKRWECWANGGRNPPNLGMNYLGELFSWDSDMEWHVDLPWYRPLRLNHWIQGSDQGWQEVGAYPAYYIDTVHPVQANGRGSPTWGTFYEHSQFPPPYRDAFLVADYQWKSATSGDYDTAGRLVVFFLQRAGAGWQRRWRRLSGPRRAPRMPRASRSTLRWSMSRWPLMDLFFFPITTRASGESFIEKSPLAMNQPP